MAYRGHGDGLAGGSETSDDALAGWPVVAGGATLLLGLLPAALTDRALARTNVQHQSTSHVAEQFAGDVARDAEVTVDGALHGATKGDLGTGVIDQVQALPGLALRDAAGVEAEAQVDGQAEVALEGDGEPALHEADVQVEQGLGPVDARADVDGGRLDPDEVRLRVGDPRVQRKVIDGEPLYTVTRMSFNVLLGRRAAEAFLSSG